MAKILVIEDDPNMSALIRFHLESERYIVDDVARGLEGLAQLTDDTYDLVILDLGLPDMSGEKICLQYRQRGGKSPVLILTSKRAYEDRIAGLDSGADDYLIKPFHPGELQARVRALLRRPNVVTGKILRVQDVEIDTATYRVTRAGVPIELVPKEFAILELLMRHPNQMFTADAVLSRVWQSDAAAAVTEDTVRTHMKTLRKKLGDTGELIRTRRGLGYQIVDA